ncbi:MAG: Spy/CpxP family protein refolding chaperone [Desulfovibrionaceae bacterium]
MSKHTKIILAVAAMAVLATASMGFADSMGGYGYGGHMMGGGYGYHMNDGNQRGPGFGRMMDGDGPGARWQALAPEKRDALVKLRQEHAAAVGPVLEELAAARAERETLLAGTNPDEKRLEVLTSTIVKLETKLLKDRTDFRAKVTAIVGEDGVNGLGLGFGFGPGRGYGPRHGFGPHRGFGPDNCPAYGWNAR